MSYRGRIAPSPTGYLHLGHARTFWTAYERAIAAGGTLVFRNEDLDPQRSRPKFAAAMFDDLRWLGIRWQEGPDIGGPFSPYVQSERRARYLHVWRELLNRGLLYPCSCSRKDLAGAAQAPHESQQDPNDEPIYNGRCRNQTLAARDPAGVTWRFRVPDGVTVRFTDLAAGTQEYTAGVDFGDFVVWRRDDVPAYQLAVVADDIDMGITEVVRGGDLLKSTARQLLIYQSLGTMPPAFYHCPLFTDPSGIRLAKRHDSLSLRQLRQSGLSPEKVRRLWTQTPVSI
ncbi:MAG TPA: tRNA glutamyl-Q(34) synthetase GluQRS [Terriglobales bacterium]